MRFNRFGAALSLLAISVVLVSGCGGSATTNGPSGKSSCGGKKTLTGGGATAQAKAMTRFVNTFEETCPDQTLNYAANGSATGISEFTSKRTDFAGSDSPLDQNQYDAARQRCGSPAWHLPVVFAPIAIAYNVNGVSSLNLDGPTAAKIFNGAITTWNDPAIQALNSGVALPAEPIHVVFRSDDSWNTNSFQQFLDAAPNGAWHNGTGRKFNGGIGEGAKGNAGTAAAVKATEASIGYTSWLIAQAQTLGTAKIITPAGPDAIGISTDAVAKTISGATISGQGNDLVLDPLSFDKPSQPGSYPIVLATYEIVCSKYPDAPTGTAVKAFLQSAIGPGQKGLADDGNVPLPDDFKLKLSAAINAIA
ncbi:MAG: phosphate ABC transporter substrate-binding protein PstS [Mycobacterium sp.]